MWLGLPSFQTTTDTAFHRQRASPDEGGAAYSSAELLRVFWPFFHPYRWRIVGPSGARKSTLFHLLLRFYDPGAGIVRLCGENLRDLSLGDIRQYIGLVPQEPALFSTSVRDNIGFGRPAGRERGRDHCRRAAG